MPIDPNQGVGAGGGGGQVGGVSVPLDADSTKFAKAFADATKSLDQFQKKSDEVLKQQSKLTTAFTAGTKALGVGVGAVGISASIVAVTNRYNLLAKAGTALTTSSIAIEQSFPRVSKVLAEGANAASLFKGKFEDLASAFPHVSAGFRQVEEGIVGGLGRINEKLGVLAKQAAPELARVAERVQPFVGAVGTAATGVFEQGKAAVRPAAAAVAPTVTGVLERGRATVTTAGDRLALVAPEAVAVATEAIDKTRAKLLALAESARGPVVAAFKEASAATGPLFSAALTSTAGAIDKATGKLLGLAAVARTTGVSGFERAETAVRTAGTAVAGAAERSWPVLQAAVGATSAAVGHATEEFVAFSARAAPSARAGLGTIEASARAVGSALTEQTTRALPAFTAAYTATESAVGKVKDAFVRFVPVLKDQVTSGVETAGTAVRTTGTYLAQQAQDTLPKFSAAWSALAGVAEKTKTSLGDVATTAGQKLVTNFTAARDALTQTATAVVTQARDWPVLTATVTAAASAIEGVKGKVQEVGAQAVPFATKQLNQLAEAASRLTGGGGGAAAAGGGGGGAGGPFGRASEAVGTFLHHLAEFAIVSVAEVYVEKLTGVLANRFTQAANAAAAGTDRLIHSYLGAAQATLSLSTSIEQFNARNVEAPVRLNTITKSLRDLSLRTGQLGPVLQESTAALFNFADSSQVSAKDVLRLTEAAASFSTTSGKPMQQVIQAIDAAMVGYHQGLVRVGIGLRDTDLAQTDYVKSLGKSVNQLTQTERAHAVTEAVIAKTTEAVKAIAGEWQGSYLISIQRANAATDEINAQLGAGAAAFEALGQSIRAGVLTTIARLPEPILQTVGALKDLNTWSLQVGAVTFTLVHRVAEIASALITYSAAIYYVVPALKAFSGQSDLIGKRIPELLLAIDALAHATPLLGDALRLVDRFFKADQVALFTQGVKGATGTVAAFAARTEAGFIRVGAAARAFDLNIAAAGAGLRIFEAVTHPIQTFTMLVDILGGALTKMGNALVFVATRGFEFFIGGLAKGLTALGIFVQGLVGVNAAATGFSLAIGVGAVAAIAALVVAGVLLIRHFRQTADAANEAADAYKNVGKGLPEEQARKFAADLEQQRVGLGQLEESLKHGAAAGERYAQSQKLITEFSKASGTTGRLERETIESLNDSYTSLDRTLKSQQGLKEELTVLREQTIEARLGRVATLELVQARREAAAVGAAPGTSGALSIERERLERARNNAEIRLAIKAEQDRLAAFEASSNKTIAGYNEQLAIRKRIDELAQQIGLTEKSVGAITDDEAKKLQLSADQYAKAIATNLEQQRLFGQVGVEAYRAIGRELNAVLTDMDRFLATSRLQTSALDAANRAAQARTIPERLSAELDELQVKRTLERQSATKTLDDELSSVNRRLRGQRAELDALLSPAERLSAATGEQADNLSSVDAEQKKIADDAKRGKVEVLQQSIAQLQAEKRSTEEQRRQVVERHNEETAIQRSSTILREDSAVRHQNLQLQLESLANERASVDANIKVLEAQQRSGTAGRADKDLVAAILADREKLEGLAVREAGARLKVAQADFADAQAKGVQVVESKATLAAAQSAYDIAVKTAGGAKEAAEAAKKNADLQLGTNAELNRFDQLRITANKTQIEDQNKILELQLNDTQNVGKRHDLQLEILANKQRELALDKQLLDLEIARQRAVVDRLAGGKETLALFDEALRTNREITADDLRNLSSQGKLQALELERLQIQRKSLDYQGLILDADKKHIDAQSQGLVLLRQVTGELADSLSRIFSGAFFGEKGKSLGTQFKDAFLGIVKGTIETQLKQQFTTLLTSWTTTTKQVEQQTQQTFGTNIPATIQASAAKIPFYLAAPEADVVTALGKIGDASTLSFGQVATTAQTAGAGISTAAASAQTGWGGFFDFLVHTGTSAFGSLLSVAESVVGTILGLLAKLFGGQGTTIGGALGSAAQFVAGTGGAGTGTGFISRTGIGAPTGGGPLQTADTTASVVNLGARVLGRGGALTATQQVTEFGFSAVAKELGTVRATLGEIGRFLPLAGGVLTAIAAPNPFLRAGGALSAVGGLSSVFPSTFPALGGSLGTIANIPIVGGAIQGLANIGTAAEAIPGLGPAITPALQAVHAAIEAIVAPIVHAVTGAVGAAAPAVTGAVGAAAPAVTGAVAGGAAATGAGSGAAGAAAGGGAGVAGAAGGAIAAIVNSVFLALRGNNNFAQGNAVSRVSAGTNLGGTPPVIAGGIILSRAQNQGQRVLGAIELVAPIELQPLISFLASFTNIFGTQGPSPRELLRKAFTDRISQVLHPADVQADLSAFLGQGVPATVQRRGPGGVREPVSRAQELQGVREARGPLSVLSDAFLAAFGPEGLAHRDLAKDFFNILGNAIAKGGLDQGQIENTIRALATRFLGGLEGAVTLFNKFVQTGGPRFFDQSELTRRRLGRETQAIQQFGNIFGNVLPGQPQLGDILAQFITPRGTVDLRAALVPLRTSVLETAEVFGLTVKQARQLGDAFLVLAARLQKRLGPGVPVFELAAAVQREFTVQVPGARELATGRILRGQAAERALAEFPDRFVPQLVEITRRAGELVNNLAIATKLATDLVLKALPVNIQQVAAVAREVASFPKEAKGPGGKEISPRGRARQEAEVFLELSASIAQIFDTAQKKLQGKEIVAQIEQTARQEQAATTAITVELEKLPKLHGKNFKKAIDEIRTGIQSLTQAAQQWSDQVLQLRQQILDVEKAQLQSNIDLRTTVGQLKQLPVDVGALYAPLLAQAEQQVQLASNANEQLSALLNLVQVIQNEYGALIAETQREADLQKKPITDRLHALDEENRLLSHQLDLVSGLADINKSVSDTIHQLQLQQLPPAQQQALLEEQIRQQRATFLTAQKGSPAQLEAGQNLQQSLQELLGTQGAENTFADTFRNAVAGIEQLRRQPQIATSTRQVVEARLLSQIDATNRQRTTPIFQQVVRELTEIQKFTKSAADQAHSIAQQQFNLQQQQFGLETTVQTIDDKTEKAVEALQKAEGDAIGADIGKIATAYVNVDKGLKADLAAFLGPGSDLNRFLTDSNYAQSILMSTTNELLSGVLTALGGKLQNAKTPFSPVAAPDLAAAGVTSTPGPGGNPVPRFPVTTPFTADQRRAWAQEAGSILATVQNAIIATTKETLKPTAQAEIPQLEDLEAILLALNATQAHSIDQRLESNIRQWGGFGEKGARLWIAQELLALKRALPQAREGAYTLQDQLIQAHANEAIVPLNDHRAESALTESMAAALMSIVRATGTDNRQAPVEHYQVHNEFNVSVNVDGAKQTLDEEKIADLTMRKIRRSYAYGEERSGLRRSHVRGLK